MFPIIGRVLMLLWPFFKEVFLKNDDVRYAIRRNWVAIVMFGVLSSLTILFVWTNDLFHRTHEEYQSVTGDYISLEVSHQELKEVRDSLREELGVVYTQFDELEDRIQTVIAENRSLKRERETLANAVRELENTCTQPTRSRIMQRLESLGDF